MPIEQTRCLPGVIFQWKEARKLVSQQNILVFQTMGCSYMPLEVILAPSLELLLTQGAFQYPPPVYMVTVTLKIFLLGEASVVALADGFFAGKGLDMATLVLPCK
jgi:hypothetical protein